MSELKISRVNKILQSIARTNNIPIENISINPNFCVGDGLVREMLKAQVGSLHLVVKTAPMDELYRKQLKVRLIYLNEMFFYEFIAPEFRNLGIDNFPLCYETVRDENEETLILNNLYEEGYTMIGDIDEIAICGIFREFARFHAASFAIKIKDPESWKHIFDNLYKDLNTFNVDTDLTESILEECEKVEKVCKYGKELKEFRQIKLRKIMNDMDRYKGEHCVVIHGDCWPNNIMSKGNRCFRFIDFQQCRIGSVIQDLTYFFYMCASKEDMKKYLHFLQVYHEELVWQFLRLEIDPNIFTFKTLCEHWKCFASYGFGMAAAVLHGKFSDPDEFPNIPAVLKEGGNIFRALNFTSRHEDAYNEAVGILVEHFVENDFF